MSLPLRTDVPKELLSLTPPLPEFLDLGYDQSCNLVCPSCRTAVHVAKAEEQSRLDQVKRSAILPLLDTARVLRTSTAGDPFASRHFRKLLLEIGKQGHHKVDLMTNGVLCDEAAWDALALNGTVRSVRVSLDASTENTYNTVRKGGNWNRVISNLRYLSSLRRTGKLDFLSLDFIVQDANLSEVGQFIQLGKELMVDKVQFGMIRNWGTYSSRDFSRHFVGSIQHKRHDEFLSILRMPSFTDPIVDPGNLWRFADVDPPTTQRSMQAAVMGATGSQAQ